MFDDVVPQLKGAKLVGSGYVALCPAHDDHEPSLSVDRAANGMALLYCHAGCPFKRIVEEFRIPLADENPKPTPAGMDIIATYDYTDLAGQLVYQVVRLNPKSFRQRRPDGKGGWDWNLNGTARMIFRWPDVAKGITEGKRIYVVEGEKDVLALESIGLVATCNSGGAGKWTNGMSDALRTADVVILPDNDDPGRKHGEQVAASLEGIAHSVHVLELPDVPDKGDASDWIAAGGTSEQLLSLVDQLGSPGANRVTSDGADDAAPIDCVSGLRTLGLVSFRDIEPEPIEWLWPNRIAAGKITVLDGDPGGGKSLVTVDIAARISTGRPFPGETQSRPPNSVVMLNAEDGESDTIRPRLEAAGADLSRIFTIAVNDSEGAGPLSIPEHIDRIKAAIVESSAKYLVIDPLMAFLGSRISAHKDQEVRRALHPLKQLAEETEAGILIVRHLNKVAGSSPLYRGGGSIGIIASARIGLVIANDPNDPSRRVLAICKTNVGRLAPSLCFGLAISPAGVPSVEWFGESPHGARDLLAPVSHEQESQLSTAKEFLLEVLPGRAREIHMQAKENGIAIPTLRRAKAALGIKAEKRGRPGSSEQEWYWIIDSEAERASA
ncbi:MAG: AAA family ATPase [Candidatus Hydrogenedentes bacterium]|nr:AAA family ATPase [Candidatus Hydrogenedentota bacterium]